MLKRCPHCNWFNLPENSDCSYCGCKMGVAGQPAITDEKLYKDSEEVEKMTCVKCKGRGYIITDIISGNSNPCECRQVSPINEDCRFDPTVLDELISVPKVGMLMEITVDGKNANSCHAYLKGNTVQVTKVFENTNNHPTMREVTHILKVTDNVGYSQAVYYPTECRMVI